MSKNTKESFVFYRSFYESIALLPEEDQFPIYKAICELALNDNTSNLDGTSLAIFKLIEPQILANNRKYKNACKGGRPKKPKQNLNKTKTKPKQNQGETKTKPNENDNVNDNVNDHVNDHVNVNVNVNGVDKDNQPVDVSDTPQQVVSELWRRYLDLSTGRPFRIKPKVGAFVYDPKTEEQKEYEGE